MRVEGSEQRFESRCTARTAARTFHVKSTAPDSQSLESIGWAGAMLPGDLLPSILYEKGIKLNLSGNEVDFTNSEILLVKSMLCSKLHCQKGFNLILF